MGFRLSPVFSIVCSIVQVERVPGPGLVPGGTDQDPEQSSNQEPGKEQERETQGYRRNYQNPECSSTLKNDFLSQIWSSGFLKITLYRPLIYHLKSSFARKSQMWWHGKGKSGGSWLSEDKKKYVARKGKQWWLMAACLPPLV